MKNNGADEKAGRILVIDDEEHIRRILGLMLGRQGYEVIGAEDGGKGLAFFESDVFDLIFLDLRMPDMDGLEVLHRIRHANPDQTVIMITAYASVDSALGAMKEGAFDYIGKPFKEDEILAVVNKALERTRLLADNQRLRSEVLTRYDFANIIGNSPPMQEVFKVMAKVADTKATVLITGDSGTGKELVARALHYNSRRREMPFVAVNCAAIPATLIEAELFGAAKGAYTGADRTRKGLLEEANGSTLFLDEVGELPLETQAKFLRALQEGEIMRVGENTTRKVEMRVVSATNKDLAKEVEAGRFREDLYYRLNVIHIHLPTMGERTDDIPLLARHFLNKAAERHELGDKRLSPEALELLTSAPLKGNVRELENLMEQAAVMSDGPVIMPGDLPVRAEASAGGIQVVIPKNEVDLKKVLKAVAQKTEKQVIGRVLAQANGNRTHTAKMLGISRRALITKIQELGLDGD